MQRRNNRNSVDLELIDLLRANGRTSFRQMARVLKLSAPTVATRIRELQEVGVVAGFGPWIDYDRLGWRLLAFVTVETKGEGCEFVRSFAQHAAQVLECHRLFGERRFLLKVIAQSRADLESLVDRIAPYGEDIHTDIVASSPKPFDRDPLPR